MTSINPYESPADTKLKQADLVFTRYPKTSLVVLALAFLLAARSLPSAIRGWFTIGDTNNLRFIALVIGVLVITATCAYAERTWGPRGLLTVPIILSPLIFTTAIALASLVITDPFKTAADIRYDPWILLESPLLFAVPVYGFLVIRRSMALLYSPTTPRVG